MVRAVRSGKCDFLGLRGGPEMVRRRQMYGLKKVGGGYEHRPSFQGIGK